MDRLYLKETSITRPGISWITQGSRNRGGCKKKTSGVETFKDKKKK